MIRRKSNKRKALLLWGLGISVFGLTVALAAPLVFPPNQKTAPAPPPPKKADTTALSPELVGLPKGWTNPLDHLVKSDGSHSLGDPTKSFNDTRDRGSKIAYFHPEKGNNAKADVYFWDGKQLVDSKGRPKNDKGLAYGTNPLAPNENAIRPFSNLLAQGDKRLKTQDARGGYKDDERAWSFAGLAGGYPDWFLFRRGQTHTTFDIRLTGGRSEQQPMVVAGYGPVKDGRAIMEPSGDNPFSGHNWGMPKSWLHHALYSLEIRAQYGYLNANKADSHSSAGGPVTAYLEDCYFPGREGGLIVYPPTKTTLFRSILSNSFRADKHNQGYYTDGYKGQTLFDRVIFYQNGYKDNPRTNADPRRDVFSRNIYQGGGAKLGHIYHAIISADGASGGPQMRLGGIIENSLVVEGYWFSSTRSNKPENEWLEKDGQKGQSARVRNNVQLVLGYPTPNDPDPQERSDVRAQSRDGFILQGASFGSVIEGNIISGAMLLDDLGETIDHLAHGLVLEMPTDQYGLANFFTQKGNTIQNNVVYRTKIGLRLGDGGINAEDVRVTRNVFVVNKPIYVWKSNTIDSPDQVLVDHNRFYAKQDLHDASWVQNNILRDFDQAKASEGWPDPDRTIKRYVLEKLGLSLLDWKDDPLLEKSQATQRAKAGEAYDPTGLKTFMAVAAHMRFGGTDQVPKKGKPNPSADYEWDERFEALAVVNWIREGFGLPPAKGPRTP